MYQDAWQGYDLDTVKFGKNENVDSLGQLADRVIAAFMGSEIARPNGVIVGVEEELRGELIESVPDLLARVDLLIDEGEDLAVIDLKTARSRWTQDQADFNAEQLLLYHELAKRLMPGKSLRLRFVVVTKTKQPTVEVYEVEYDQQRLERTKETVKRVWRAIEGGNFFPAPSAMSCPGCAYRDACRAWTG